MTKVAYITSLGFSGSTLLDLLISAHSAAVSVGEIIFLDDYTHGRRKVTAKTPYGGECTCGTPSLSSCPFWSEVTAELERSSNLKFGSLNLRTTDLPKFYEENAGLFAAVQRVSGAKLIVDSSKDPGRLARLLQTSGLDVRPVYLHRAELGVANSMVKRGYATARAGISITNQTLKITRAISNHMPIFVDYDDLVREPGSTMSRVMDELGLDYEEAQLDWAGRERHLVGGNRMRRATSSLIRQDDNRRLDNLSSFQYAVLRTMTFPARIASQKFALA